jgi:hypothetical protein
MGIVQIRRYTNDVTALNLWTAEDRDVLWQQKVTKEDDKCVFVDYEKHYRKHGGLLSLTKLYSVVSHGVTAAGWCS